MLQQLHLGRVSSLKTKFKRRLYALLLTVSLMCFGLVVGAAPASAVGSYNNASIADIALTKIGQDGGQCKEFANNMVKQASGNTQWPAPGYHSGFANAGGIEVSSQNATKGDIIQIGNSDYDYPLHTAIIVTNKGGGSFNVVDSNWSLNEIVKQHDLNPYTWASGSNIKIWRMGAVTSAPPPSSEWGGVGNATFLGTSKLIADQRVYKNQYIMSPAGRYVLVLQSDGNLVLYSGTRALWASGTGGLAVDYVKAQSDGNMVIYGPQGGVWGTNTAGQGGSATELRIQDDGNVVMSNGSAGPFWATGTSTSTPTYTNIGGSQLVVDQKMYKNQYITSPDKRYVFMLQSDGNLILYAPGYKPLWASNTSGVAVDHVKVQSDGNMVIYGPQGGVWSTGTAGRGGSATVLKAQNDGNFVIYNGTAGAIWATGTSGRLK